MRTSDRAGQPLPRVAVRHRGNHLSIATSVTAAVMAALYGSAANADDNALQEVVVTATRRALSVQDVPISITAVTGTTLEQAGIQDIAGLAHSVAGVNYTDKGPYGGVAGSTLIIRGLNSEDTADLAFPSPIVPPVATYVDETPLFFNLRLQDLDHVEILRGPQGTLYGSGSLGGTIRFVQNAPDPSGFDAKAEVGASKTAHTHALNDDVNGMLNLPLSETFAVRQLHGPSGIHQSAQSFRTRSHRRPNSDDAGQYLESGGDVLQRRRQQLRLPVGARGGSLEAER
jgi:iron complex outermembrane recepter protein